MRRAFFRGHFSTTIERGRGARRKARREVDIKGPETERGSEPVNSRKGTGTREKERERERKRANQFGIGKQEEDEAGQEMGVSERDTAG